MTATRRTTVGLTVVLALCGVLVGPVAGDEEPRAKAPPSVRPVRVRVRTWDGVPVAGVRLWAGEGDGSDSQGAASGADGWAEFDALDVGHVYKRLAIVPPYERLDLRPSSIANWSPRDTEIRVERGYVLSGRVLDDRGRPLEGVRVEALSDQGFDINGATDAEGRYRLGKLRSGRFDLRASYFYRPATCFSTREVAAEQAVADLTLDPGRTVRVRFTGGHAGGAFAGGKGMPTVYVEGPSGWRRVGSMPGHAPFEGVLEVRGLPHGRRAAFEWCPWRVSLAYAEIDADAAEVEAEWQEARYASVRVSGLPTGARATLVLTNGGPLTKVGKTAGEVHRFGPLPAGIYTVTATAEAPDGTLRRAAGTVTAGKELELLLQPPH